MLAKKSMPSLLVIFGNFRLFESRSDFPVSLLLLTLTHKRTRNEIKGRLLVCGTGESVYQPPLKTPDHANTKSLSHLFFSHIFVPICTPNTVQFVMAS
jgi:hypothetical protein